ncbi:MAG TPA: hypothetical protein VGF61_17085 [Candidatus Acidoferrum sp.]|jgi:hypothetical protein
MNDKPFEGMNTRGAAGTALALLMLAGVAKCAPLPFSPATHYTERQTMAMETKFYCNVKALNSAERASHKQLTRKLIAVRTEIVEMDRGYEFQFSPSTVTLAELADWVVAEGKCCPFFDFHIDLEREGKLLCLRLTGEEGIKAFIRAEFQVSGKQQ